MLRGVIAAKQRHGMETPHVRDTHALAEASVKIFHVKMEIIHVPKIPTVVGESASQIRNVNKLAVDPTAVLHIYAQKSNLVKTRETNAKISVKFIAINTNIAINNRWLFMEIFAARLFRNLLDFSEND